MNNTTFLNFSVTPNLSTSTASPLNEANAIELYTTTTKIVALSLIYGFIAIIAFVGHLLTIVVIIKDKNMHTGTNILIVNHSLCSILLACFIIPWFLALEICNNRWPFSEFAGKILPQASTTFGTSILLTAIATGYERYVAIVYPLRRIAGRKKATIAILLVFIWLSSIAVSLPFGIYTTVASHHLLVKRGNQVTFERVTFLSSSLTEEESRAHATVIFVFPFSTTVILTIFFYGRITWKLWHPDKQLAKTSDTKVKNVVNKRRRKTTMMLLTVILNYIVTAYPLAVCSFVNSHIGYNNINVVVFAKVISVLNVTSLLGLTSTPFIYAIFNQKFRSGFRNLLCCFLKKQ